jgi:hypothetical protein
LPPIREAGERQDQLPVLGEQVEERLGIATHARHGERIEQLGWGHVR